MIDQDELIKLIKDLTDSEPCALDHKGFCQSHGWMAPECPHAKAKRITASLESERIPIQLMQLICALNGTVLTPMPGRDQDGLYQIDQIVSEIPQASVISLLSFGLIEQLDPKKWTYCLSSKGRESVEEYC